MGNKYTVGIGVQKDCIASVAYLKDPAYRSITNPNTLPYQIKNYHLAREIFSMKVNQRSSIVLRKRNSDKIKLLKQRSAQGSAKDTR